MVKCLTISAAFGKEQAVNVDGLSAEQILESIKTLAQQGGKQ